MQPKPLYQKKQALGMTLSLDVVNTIDQARGLASRSATVEDILRKHFNLVGRKKC
jgi:hypothetical protein